MAQLLLTTPKFVIHARSLPGVPILVDREMRLVEPACAWFLHLALISGRTRSPLTWKTYGEAVYDWWQTLEANGWAWTDVTYREVAAWRELMLSPPDERRPCAPATVNLRLTVLQKFYSWCVRRELISRTPFAAADMRVHASRSAEWRSSSSDLKVRNPPKFARALRPEEVRRILEQMGPRDRLITQWGLLAGLRRMEVAHLHVDDLPKASIRENAGLVPVQLLKTKGGQRRTAYPPLPLVDRTQAYIREERQAAVRRLARRGLVDSGALFLSADGRPLQERRISEIFHDAAVRVGVRARFHELRHTYATTLRSSLAANGVLDPLLTVQLVLGHKNRATTEIYDKITAVDMDAIEASLEAFHQSLFGNC